MSAAMALTMLVPATDTVNAAAQMVDSSFFLFIIGKTPFIFRSRRCAVNFVVLFIIRTVLKKF